LDPSLSDFYLIGMILSVDNLTPIKYITPLFSSLRKNKRNEFYSGVAQR